ncbi:SDR family NAD(P)-dependent oxidoreductase [Sphingomonas bacterium]|uniref:SDR family NAD(P)-dependent oxidoreductase n=1 Tax=Sphingomonas bacterium TaxID=1895847 RepID=UPI00157638AF|nr:SDR family oxidoreductase [Sphingomonas bacterium]
MELGGKVAIVTGAGAGIGRAYALALAAAGAKVVAIARTLGLGRNGEAANGGLAEVVRAGSGLPGRIYAQVCDVGDEAALVRTIDEAGANFGRIDILANNAAIMDAHDTFDITGEAWDAMMRVNVRAPYLAIRQAAPFMMRQRSGSIINITARGGDFLARDDPAHHRLLPYGVSKAALNRLSHFMAEELRPHGIAVNALSPGVVLTRPSAAGFAGAKPATPEILGPALIFLARQSAETLTGKILHTDEFGKSWGAADED